MGGNQSKTYTKSDFTFDQSWSIMSKIQNDINVIMKTNAKAISEASISGVTIKGDTGGNYNVKAISTATVQSGQEIAASLEAISNENVSGLVALDVLNGIKNENQQDISATIGNKSESKVISNTKFNIDTCVDVCNQLSACIDVAANVISESRSVIRNIDLENNTNTTLNLTAESNAETISKQLGNFINKAAKELTSGVELDSKFTNDMDTKNEQSQEMLENVADEMSAVAQKITEEVGQTARSWMDSIKSIGWILAIPIVIVVLIVLMFLLPKILSLFKSKNKKGDKKKN